MTDATAPAKLPGGITGKGFRKGDDPRRYRGGAKAQAGFADLRKMALRVLEETATNKDGTAILRPDGKPMSNAEVVLRTAMRDPRRALQVLEIAYGKVPQEVQVSGNEGGAIQVLIAYADDHGNAP